MDVISNIKELEEKLDLLDENCPKESQHYLTYCNRQFWILIINAEKTERFEIWGFEKKFDCRINFNLRLSKH